MVKYLIKNYKCSIFCILLIWVLCFCSVPHTELDNVSFIDKWVHVLMYLGTCTIIWIEYLRCHHSRHNTFKLVTWAICAPIVMSGTIELLQEYTTNGRRSGDWFDMAANSLGVLLAALVGWTILRRWIK